MPLLAPAPHRSIRRWMAGLLVIAVLTAAGGQVHAQAAPAAGQWTLSAGTHYSIGDYGTSEPTEVVYVPLTLRYDSNLGAATLTVPYISIRGKGEPVEGGVVFDPDSDKEVFSSGLGDVLATLTYTAYRGTEPWPWVDFTAIVKFATADPDQQLGTGKNDYAAQVDAYQRWGAWNWFASLGYRAPGSPPDIEFHNVFYALAGASYPLAETFKAGLMWSGQESLTEGADPQQEVTAFSAWALTPKYTLHSYIARGLTDSSAEWAAGVTIARTF